MCYRGFGSVRGYDGLPDLFHQVRQTMARDRHERSFYYLYWGGVDTAIHAHGSAGGHWQEQVERLREAFQEQFWARMTPKAATETALIITADHGFVDSPAEDAHDCDADPVLRRELLIPFSGESRAAYLHTLAGDDERTLGTIQTALGDEYIVRRTCDLVAQGLFGLGPIGDETMARLGHLGVLPLGRHYLDRQERRFVLRGRHGGLSREEMLIPWVALRLDG
jgi:hypothetical protein